MPARRPSRLAACELEGRLVPTAGALDATFGSSGLASANTGASDTDRSILLQTDGKVVMAGCVGNGQAALLIRFTSKGLLDNSFNGNGKEIFTPAGTNNGAFSNVAEQADGKLVAVGTFGLIADGHGRLVVARFNPDGSLDNTFATGGMYQDPTPGSTGSTVAIQSDGKIVVTGTNGPSAVYRFNSDGSLDDAFGSNGIVEITAPGVSPISALLIQSDGEIVIAGTALGGGFGIERFNSDGTIDTSFGNNGSVASTPPNTSSQGLSAVVQEADGKLVAAGTCGLGANASPAPTILRYNTDGTPDTTLGGTGYAINYNSTGGNGSWLAGVAVQPDDKIIAVGALAKSGGNVAMVARYNFDGTPDGTFGPAGQTFSPGVVQLIQTTEFHGVALISDGRIVAGGSSGGSFLAGRFLPDNDLIAKPDEYPFDENTQLTVSAPGVIGNDVILQGNPTAELVSGPSHAAVFTLNPDGSFDYLPVTDYHGTDSFTYRLVNGTDTSAPATVSLLETASLSFSAASYPVSVADGVATITVHRLFDSQGAITVNYSTGDGSATAPLDYTATSGTLSWADGDGADKTFTVPLIDNGTSDGDESFNVLLSSPGGNAEIGPLATGTVTIAKHRGLSPGTTFTDADGDIVTVKMLGPVGTSNFYLTDGIGPISEIDLSGTDSTKSILRITVKKAKGGTGDGRVSVDEIVGTGLKMLSAPKADLVGTGINLTSFLGSLSIGAIENGADVNLAGAPPTAKGATRVTAGVIGDGTDISITGAPLGRLTATSIGMGSITAPSVRSIVVTGKAKTKSAPAIPGDFKSSLTIAGTGLVAKVPALKSLRVAGSVSGSTILVGGVAGTVGDVGTVQVGSFISSRLFAGYTGPDNGSGTFNLPSTVGSFTVTGKTNAFSQSFVIATNFKNVSLASVKTDNGGTKFGFLAHGAIKHLSIANPKFHYDPAGSITQGVQDFEANIV